MSGTGWRRRFLGHSRPELVCPCVLEPGGSGGAVHTQTTGPGLGCGKGMWLDSATSYRIWLDSGTSYRMWLDSETSYKMWLDSETSYRMWLDSGTRYRM